MCLWHAINVGLVAELDTVSSGEDVNVIALLVEISFSFNAHGSTFSLDMLADLSNEKFNGVWRLSTNCKIINLAAD